MLTAMGHHLHWSQGAGGPTGGLVEHRAGGGGKWVEGQVCL